MHTYTISHTNLLGQRFLEMFFCWSAHTPEEHTTAIHTTAAHTTVTHYWNTLLQHIVTKRASRGTTDSTS